MIGVTPAWMLTSAQKKRKTSTVAHCLNGFCYSGKIQYGSETLAWDKAAHLVEFRNHDDLKVYFCCVCRHFHLTTAPVQLHDQWWRMREGYRFSNKVRNWFRERGTIDEWDME